MNDQNKNSKEITEKNLAIANRLKSGEKVVISEVNGRQRFYTTFSDGSCVAFEMDSGDNGYSMIDISEDGYEFNITKDFDHSWTISEDEQRYIRDNIIIIL